MTHVSLNGFFTPLTPISKRLVFKILSSVKETGSHIRLCSPWTLTLLKHLIIEINSLVSKFLSVTVKEPGS